MNHQFELEIYTRMEETDYHSSLANSIHFSLYENNEKKPLNHNYGMLFAKGCIKADNTIIEKGLNHPFFIAGKDNTVGITASRIEQNGREDITANGKHLFWTTEDFVEFQEYPLVSDTEICELLGISPQQIKRVTKIEVTKEQAERIQNAWMPISHRKTIFPEHIVVHTEQELNMQQAVAEYSDGSTASKRVQWDGNLTAVFRDKGTSIIKGHLKQERYPFPLAMGYADPVIKKWNNKFYFIATNDNTNAIGLFIREADNIKDLFEKSTVEYQILYQNEEKGFVQTFWAPELHIIGGKLYILFAVSGIEWGPQCYMMRLKKNGEPVNPEDWEEPVKVLRRDGSNLGINGITLDMTYFKVKDCSYLVWSYREHIMQKEDTGSMLMIARIDDNNPTRLDSTPILLSRPLYGWENGAGTINNEGPFAFQMENKIYLCYSGGAAGGYSYNVGYLSADITSDLLDCSRWKKGNTPVLSHLSMKGIYGPGHCSFFMDEEENLMIAYHAQSDNQNSTRCTGIHRIHTNQNKRPVFDLCYELDIDSRYSTISTILEVI